MNVYLAAAFAWLYFVGGITAVAYVADEDWRDVRRHLGAYIAFAVAWPFVVTVCLIVTPLERLHPNHKDRR